MSGTGDFQVAYRQRVSLTSTVFDHFKAQMPQRMESSSDE
jgi:hypothetical protein